MKSVRSAGISDSGSLLEGLDSSVFKTLDSASLEPITSAKLESGSDTPKLAFIASSSERNSLICSSSGATASKINCLTASCSIGVSLPNL